MLGVDFGKVKVVAYRPEWSVLYLQECEAIRAALGQSVVAIEHIGSTSIPGMPSKPILDIMAIVCGTTEVGDLVDGLGEIDYHFEPDEPVPSFAFCHCRANLMS